MMHVVDKTAGNASWHKFLNSGLIRDVFYRNGYRQRDLHSLLSFQGKSEMSLWHAQQLSAWILHRKKRKGVSDAVKQVVYRFVEWVWAGRDLEDHLVPTPKKGEHVYLI